MSEPTPAPSTGVPPPPATPGRSVPARHWAVLAGVAAVAMLVGAAIATTVLLVVVQVGQAQHRYEVGVLLDLDATAEQKDVIKSALTALRPVDGIRLQSREETWERFKEQFKDQPDLVNAARPESMPESFRLRSTGKTFDCEALTPVRRLPGVDEITVLQLPADGRPGAVIDCS
ncbi:permease-like cell division protein FtsX [Plantactinospora soyae]|uniref:Cell division protein FtsX n=1 Tax=Plantactinospora soyae TaxID=1544732 RepID=A0A927M516_9ACTN|nr:permease-like cell division protein FtsX [Plantactinospora soyae]MBE1488152.1 cell division protein FtsX [Plantactinospora soyae]